MKSAYELAMERLQKDSPIQSLSDSQKKEIAETEQIYQAKTAERKIFLQSEINKSSDPAEIRQLEQQLAHDLKNLQEEAEAKKEKIRQS